MRHVPDGVLRRLDDEPLAIPDRVTDHLGRCERCSARRAEIALDTERAAQLFSAPRLAPDVDVAWARIRRDLDRSPADAGSSAPVVAPRPRFPRPSLRAVLAVAAISIVVAGTAAAATLTTIFAPTRVTPVTVTRNELRAIAALTGLGGGHPLGGFTTQSGSSTLRFGTITWSSSPVQPAASLAQASAQAGFPMILPAHLPSGVGAVRQFSVQPRVTATVTFNARAAGLTGSSVTIAAGPAVVAEYSAAGGSGVPTLGVATIRRPTAQTTGASMSQIEAFLLGQPGIPPELADEVRLLGDLRTTLPVPVPPGAKVHSVRINGWSGVLLTDPSNTVAAVIWEDGRGFVHGVAGIINSQDILNVARQLS